MFSKPILFAAVCVAVASGRNLREEHSEQLGDLLSARATTSGENFNSEENYRKLSEQHSEQLGDLLSARATTSGDNFNSEQNYRKLMFTPPFGDNVLGGGGASEDFNSEQTIASNVYTLFGDEETIATGNEHVDSYNGVQ